MGVEFWTNRLTKDLSGLVEELVRIRPEVAGNGTWRSKLWTVAPETRLNVDEVCEALGRSRTWLYKQTGPSVDTDERIPSRKRDGSLVFCAGELREWWERHERKAR